MTNKSPALPNVSLMSRVQVEMYAKSLTASLQIQSIRAQMLACELQRVDKDNKIFDMGEGIIDKKYLYLIRKTIADGMYLKMRDNIRIKRRSQNLKG